MADTRSPVFPRTRVGIWELARLGFLFVWFISGAPRTRRTAVNGRTTPVLLVALFPYEGRRLLRVHQLAARCQYPEKVFQLADTLRVLHDHRHLAPEIQTHSRQSQAAERGHSSIHDD